MSSAAGACQFFFSSPYEPAPKLAVSACLPLAYSILPPQPPKSCALMQRWRDPLPLGRTFVVAHEIMDVVQQRLCLGKVGMAQQIDVKVRHGHRINAGSDGVGYVVSATRRVVQLRGEMHW